MTQSYFEYLGRQEAAPFTNEKLDYEETEPDPSKKVNQQIDQNIKDREQFFQDQINIYNQTVAGKLVNLTALAQLTKTGKAFLDKRQEYAEEEKLLTNQFYNDPTACGRMLL